MSDYTFAGMPSVSIARSKFNRTFSHNLSFNHGELRILALDEVIPGSTHRLDFGALIRMSTPIAPIMDDIQFDIYTFFVPCRLTWSNWKYFMGENTTGAGFILPANQKTIPSVTCYGSMINTIADDMGIPGYQSGNGPVNISVLPLRAVKITYNRWFRNQNVEAPLSVSTGDTLLSGEALSYGLELSSSGGSTNPGCLTAYKLPDYFTSALPYAQKGDPVQIPLAGLAAVGVVPTTSGSGSGGSISLPSGSYSAGLLYQATSSTPVTRPVVADLSTAVNSTINDLRFAFQLQKFLEKDAMYGTRYWEILRAHYSVTAPDASLQDPQLLGHVKFDINISQVLQTTGFVDPTNTNLGTPGANSVTGKNGNLCSASFVEHGYLITLGVARQKNHTYSQGVNRIWTRSSRTDFYFPVFANLGAQSVLTRELCLAVGYNGNNPFGYQEAWAEYRFLPSYNSGLLNPTRPSALDYWTLADNFASLPTLGITFLKESRDNITRALTTSTGGPDYIGSFYFKDTCVNPMPLYSIPGFADHH